MELLAAMTHPLFEEEGTAMHTNSITVEETIPTFSIDSGEKNNTQEYTVSDKGTCIEFVLPQGTAQFVEIYINDAYGNQIWKTQAFNKQHIKWYKQTSLGTKAPQGRYTFKLKQGRRKIHGVTVID